jgi:hypothetical protein
VQPTPCSQMKRHSPIRQCHQRHLVPSADTSSQNTCIGHGQDQNTLLNPCMLCLAYSPASSYSSRRESGHGLQIARAELSGRVTSGLSKRSSRTDNVRYVDQCCVSCTCGWLTSQMLVFCSHVLMCALSAATVEGAKPFFNQL